MTTTVLTSPLMGANYRPAAKLVLSLLPSGTELILSPEPDNIHDEFAIKVLVEPKLLPEQDQEVFGFHLQGYGLTMEDIMAAPIWLGYVAMTRPEKDIPVGNREFLQHMQGTSQWSAQLTFSTEGRPQVELHVADPDDLQVPPYNPQPDAGDR